MRDPIEEEEANFTKEYMKFSKARVLVILAAGVLLFVGLMLFG